MKDRLLGALSLLAWSTLTAAQQVPPPNDRLHVNTDGDVRVTAAVPSAAETREIFEFPLYRRNIQPVWIQVENLGSTSLWLLPVGIDETYFTPIEASYLRRERSEELSVAQGQSFYSTRMPIGIAGGEVRSGYIYSRLDAGTKSFNVDIFGPGEQHMMSFFVPVPGLRIDHYDVDWANLYGPTEFSDVDLPGLIDGLEALPCCVTDKRGKNNGDPLNIAVVGDIRDVHYSLLRAGWDETETTYGSSLIRTVRSALFGSEYRYSPVSALYVFGRAQDAALQKARASIHQRNHLRLWLTPMRYEGKLVFIGQISRDIGVRWTTKTITTHKIDPDVDETREYLLEDLAYAQSLAAFGHVRGVGAAPYDEPRRNLTGDPYFTDGLRLVLFLSNGLNDIAELERLDLGSGR